MRAWYCSGISAVIFSSSSNEAVRIFLARLVFPAPRMTHGLALIFPSDAAVARMVRSSP